MAGRDQRHTKPAPRRVPPPKTSGRAEPTDLDGIREMQATAGNRAVAHLLATGGGRVTPLQRVRIDGARSTETLLWDQNQPGTGTATTPETATQQFQPRDFSASGGDYDATRAGTDVTLDVHIVFVDSGTNHGKALPDGDERRAWASGMCGSLVGVWNGAHGRFELLSHRHPAAPAGPPSAAPAASATPATPPPPAPAGPAAADPNEVTLGIRFVATPVFDVGADAKYPRVAVHKSAEKAAGNLTGGTAITAGDWFMTKDDNVYPASYDSIYAHEYGHLLGIPDEYSQNNPQMHALFHAISPANETKMNDALDRAAVDYLVMTALQAPLRATIGTVATQVATAIQGQHAAIDRALATAIRRAWRDPAAVDALGGSLRDQLLAAGQRKAAAAVPTSAHFEAFENLSNITLAQTAVSEEIDPAAILRIVTAAFNSATEINSNVTIHWPGGPGGADASATVDLDMSSGAQTNASTGPLATAAQAAATSTTTPPPPPPGAAAHHRPPANLKPSQTIIGQLLDLPNQWAKAKDLMAPESGDMVAKIQQAIASMAFDTSSINDSVPAVYQVLYAVVQAVSDTVATQAVRQFLADEINPVVEDQVNLILHAVEDEVQKTQVAAGTSTSAVTGAPPEPGVATAAQQMATQVATLMARPAPTAAAGTGTGAASTQTAQDVRYTIRSQMGQNSASTDVRPDNLANIVNQVNTHIPDLRHADEDAFTVRNK